ncbi:alpha/beta family hydrolase [Ornithinimicrobium sp. W1665]|uniref:alpha/beta hydrolase family protein n=1 Tax=Ornithinimicrobium sp. W1665 TaxID=3416666 RepID=UPI003CEC8475
MTPADHQGVLVPTDQGPGRVRVFPARERRGTLLLGHGAGGQRDSPDLLALTALADHGWTVVLVDQPWRVAGRRVATAPPRLDAAWRQVVAALALLTDVPGAPEAPGSHREGRAPAAPGSPGAQHGIPLPRPWVLGGRSAGARVACRTSVAQDGTPVPGVAAVVCLSFPLHPPGRPDRSRADELVLPVRAGLPTLVVQGSADPFGGPDEVRRAVPDPLLTVVPVRGTHSPADLPALSTAVRMLLDGLPTADPEDPPP